MNKQDVEDYLDAAELCLRHVKGITVDERVRCLGGQAYYLMLAVVNEFFDELRDMLGPDIVYLVDNGIISVEFPVNPERNFIIDIAHKEGEWIRKYGNKVVIELVCLLRYLRGYCDFMDNVMSTSSEGNGWE